MVVPVGHIEHHQGIFGVMPHRDAHVAVAAVDLEDAAKAADDQALEIELGRNAQEHLLVLGRQNAIERVAAFLVDMAERQGGLQQVDLPMSRVDIGDYLGLTIETVSRVFTRLKDKGVIRLLNLRSIEIVKQDALQYMSE